MSRKLHSIIIIWLVATVLQAQTKVDSLIQLLSTAEENQSVEIMIEIASITENNNDDFALEYANKAIAKAKKLKNNLLIQEAYFKRGEVLGAKYKDNEALNDFFAAYHYQKITNSDAKAKIFNNIGLSYYYLNKQDSAKYYYNIALKEATGKNSLTDKGNALFYLANINRKNGEQTEAIRFFKQSIEYYTQNNDERNLGKVYNSLGLVFFEIDQYDSALLNYKRSVEYRRKINDNEGVGNVVNNMGNVSFRWGKYDQALKYYQEALSYFEKSANKKGMASIYNNIGLIYENLDKGDLVIENEQNFNKAIAFYNKALALNTDLNALTSIADNYNNLGNSQTKLIELKLSVKYGESYADSIRVHKNDTLRNEFNKALNYYNKAQEIFTNYNNKKGIADLKNNIGRIYLYLGKYNDANQQFNEALELCRAINLQNGIALNLYQLAMVHLANNQYDQALSYFNQAIKLANALNLNELRKSAFLYMSVMYEKNKQPELALEAYKRYIQVRDTIFNEDNYKNIQELRTIYDTEKNEQALQQAKERDLLNAQIINQQKLIIYAFIIVFIIIVLFIIIVIRQNKAIKKANLLLEEKNETISKQNKEIKDSIHYAQRIQRAVLPPNEYLQRILPDHFVLFKPRDIVSGDFYWVTEHNGETIIATADCTGHGVPGAFMSMLGVAFLNEIVNKHDKIHAHEILNELRSQIIKSLHQTGEIGGSQDGMDISLYIIKHDKKQLEFSGANNPLIIVRNNEVIQYKGDKMPIGIYIKASEKFNSTLIDLQKDDIVYTFSDGYQDQFGGPDGRKFMIKKLKELLVEINQKPMIEQKEILDNTIIQWIGESHQIDDIIVVGVKI